MKLSSLLRRVSNGEEIIISQHSKLVARLVAVAETIGKRQPGSLRGRLEIGQEFFDALPEKELSAWNQGGTDA